MRAYAKYNLECDENLVDNQRLFDFRAAFRFYHKLSSTAGLPFGSMSGTFPKVMYTVNGEASDWMLAHRGIFAMSPELSTVNPETMDFFMETDEAVREVLQTHYPWVRHTILNMLEDETTVNVDPFAPPPPPPVPVSPVPEPY